jgi:hypothetical protein
MPMPKPQIEMLPCVHSFESDPWELQTRRCIYCYALFEDVVPLKLPPKAPRVSINSALVRTLRNFKPPPSIPVPPLRHRLR